MQRTSDADKKRRGTYRPSRAQAAYAVKDAGKLTAAIVKPANLKCPSHITDDAKREWRRLYILLKDRLQNSDAIALELHAVAVANWRAALARLAVEGAVVTDARSKHSKIVKRSPLVDVADVLFRQVVQSAKLLGIDPGTRAKQTIDPGRYLAGLTEEELQQELELIHESAT